MKTVVFSHGFGVRKNSRGMFTDIVAALKDVNCVLFDYGSYDETTNSLGIGSLSEQAQKLSSEIKKVKDDAIILVCHSQGCVVAGLTDLGKVKKIILLAPAIKKPDADRFARKFSGREGTVIDFEGVSKIKRRDGSITEIGPEYWPDYKKVNPTEIFNAMANKKEVIMVWASEDEGLSKKDLSANIKILEIKADHNFTGEARGALIQKVKQLIEEN